MELDNLKQTWDQQSKHDLKITHIDFMNLVHNKAYGPLSVLKNKFLMQLLAFPVFVAIMIYKFYTRPELLQDITVWFFVAAVAAAAGYFVFNYNIISRLQNDHSNIKATLEKDIRLLESGFKRYFIISGVALLCFIVLLEVLMHLHKLPDLEFWSGYPIYFRVVAYIVLMTGSYFLARYSFNNQYGRHILHLKKLLEHIG